VRHLNPDVWFAIPSASPERCRRTLPAWRERGYKVAILQNFERGDIPADRTLWSDHYPGWPESINILCRSVVPKDAAIVVSGGDDMLPDANLSASDIAAQFLEHFKHTPGGTFGVMQPTGDGFLGARYFCGSPWLGRAWIDSMYSGAGPMFGGYRHNWADNELFWVAKGLGALWERPDLSQHHEHFSRTGEAKPAYWVQGVERHDRDDVQLFIARSWQNFPGHQPSPDALATNTIPTYDPAILTREGRGLAETYWLTRYGSALLAAGPEHRLRAALASCASRGLTRIAILGAGSNTRACANLLMDPPARVTCLLDDNPSLRGKKLWNYPIFPLRDAISLQLQAVVISAAAMEEELWAAAEPLRRAGIEVIRPGREPAATEASSSGSSAPLSSLPINGSHPLETAA
jgi:hypothetical protein